MLDLDHPETPLVFAASVQLDLILDYSKRITLPGVSGRKFMLEVIQPAFAALRLLAKERFAGSPQIVDGIAELERQTEQLSSMSLCNPEHRGGPAARCPACGGEPTAPSKYDPTSYCSPCLDIIMPALVSCEEGFGTEGI